MAFSNNGSRPPCTLFDVRRLYRSCSRQRFIFCHEARRRAGLETLTTPWTKKSEEEVNHHESSKIRSQLAGRRHSPDGLNQARRGENSKSRQTKRKPTPTSTER